MRLPALALISVFVLAACGTNPPPAPPADAANEAPTPDAPPVDAEAVDSAAEASTSDTPPAPDAAPDLPPSMDAPPDVAGDAAHHDLPSDAVIDIAADASADANPCRPGETLCDRPGNPNACRNLLRGVLKGGMIYSCGACNHACWVGARCVDGRCQ